jgi:hypothetical protein
MTLTQAEKQFVIDHSKADPDYFWRSILGSSSVYDKQLQMSRAVRDHPRVAVVGANGTGKDWQSARIMLWWMATRSPAICVVLGPTHRQVSDIVWKEARSAYLTARLPLGGQMYRTARWEFDDRRYAVGFSTDNEYNIQGFHSPSLLVIITEAHNVEQAHIDAVKRLNPARMLLTGNAFADTGEFYDAFHGGGDLYHTISISAADTPNIQEGREVIPGPYRRLQRRREGAAVGQVRQRHRRGVVGTGSGLPRRDHRHRRQPGGDRPAIGAALHSPGRPAYQAGEQGRLQEAVQRKPRRRRRPGDVLRGAGTRSGSMVMEELHGP